MAECNLDTYIVTVYYKCMTDYSLSGSFVDFIDPSLYYKYNVDFGLYYECLMGDIYVYSLSAHK